MMRLLNAKTISSAVMGIVLGAVGMGTTIATNSEYVISWVSNWYCEQDANKRLKYRERLYEVTKPHKLTMGCAIQLSK